MKKYIFLLYAFLSLNLIAQIEDPVEWSFSVDSVSEDMRFLVIHADIEKGWNVYSQHVDPDGPVPTSFMFNKSSGYKLIGSVDESNTITKFDPVFQMELSSFQTKAVFKQKIQLLNDTLSIIKGELEFMVCNSTMCLPPDYIDMKFYLKKKKSNKGCTDPLGINYNVEATQDDNSCYYCYEEPVIETDGIVSFGNIKGDYREIFVTSKLADSVSTKRYMVKLSKQLLVKENDFVKSGMLLSESKYKISSIDLKNPLSQCSDETSQEEGQEESQSFFGIFLLGVIGGLIALLTPCVFPMIPLTVSFFTKGAENRSKAISKAFLYGFFIFLTYVVLSIPFHIFSVSPDVFNAISTDSSLNVIFFLIFMAFAISFFGYFEITLPSSWTNRVGSGRDIGGVIGIFFMALTLAIVSFSCTGPILGTLLAGTLSTSTEATTLMFGIQEVSLKLTLAMAGFGFALGIPFALFAAFPTWLKSLPKSGSWLNSVKVVLGFLEIALAIKFLSNADLVEQWGLIKRETFFALWFLTFLGLFFYIVGVIKFPHDNPKIKLGGIRISFALLVFAFLIYLFPGITCKSWQHSMLSGFPPPVTYSYCSDQECVFTHCYKDYEKGVNFAKEHNMPIMLDFTGWACVNCRDIEENIWTKKDVFKLLDEKYVVISLYVDAKVPLEKNKQERVYICDNDGKLLISKNIKKEGNKWSTLQTLTYSKNSQPLYVLMTPDERLLSSPVGYSYAKDANNYFNFLNCGLTTFDSIISTTNNEIRLNKKNALQ